MEISNKCQTLNNKAHLQTLINNLSRCTHRCKISSQCVVFIVESSPYLAAYEPYRHEGTGPN